MRIYRDGSISEADKSSAHEVVTIFADYFDTFREGLIDPAWQHDWPTREEILENYFVHSSSYAHAMGANVAVDVMAGCVRVLHERRKHEPGEEAYPIKLPLLVYTRRCITSTPQETVPQQQEEKWVAGLRRTSKHVISVPLPPNPNYRWDHRRDLSVDVAFPRHLEARLVKWKVDHGGEVLPAPRYESTFRIQRGGKELVVIVKQLAVELPANDPVQALNTGESDDRGNGGALTPGTTCILVEIRDSSNPGRVLTAFLRGRIQLVTHLDGRIVGEKWTPQISASEPEPAQHRVGDVVKLGLPPSSQSHATASVPELRPPINIRRAHPHADVSASGTRGHESSRARPLAQAPPPRPRPRHAQLAPHSTSPVAPSAASSPQRTLPSFRDFIAELSRHDTHELGIRQQGIYRQRFAQGIPL